MVTRVWGKADSFELVFSHSGDSWRSWNASVPADLADGQYIVELYCEDDGGNTAYWTGILYLNKSENVKVRIVADKFRLWLMNDMEITMQAECKVWMCEERINLTVTCTNHVCGG